jgi:SNF2 family DNA or RNA helicase
VNRTFGKLEYRRAVTFMNADAPAEYNESALWRLTGEPHLLLRVKRIFGRVNKHEHGAVHLKDNEEVRRDLEWLLMRYPIRISKRHRGILEAGAQGHRERMLRLEKIIGPRRKPGNYELAIAARDYQRVAADLFLERGFLLVADDVGIGKTATAICAMVRKGTLPAVVVTLSGTMPRQWADEVALFAPGLTTHVLKEGTPYKLPLTDGKAPDVVILNYHKLSGWAEVLRAYAGMVVFDECQELRRRGSQKYNAAEHVARGATYRLGLSATPIYNYGGELWNVIHVLDEDVLGTWDEFRREWCEEGYTKPEHVSIKEPKAMGTYLREHFVMLRRTRKDVGRELPEVSRIPQHVQCDREALENVEDAASELARIVLEQSESYRGEKMLAADRLDNMIRQATGIAKAPYVAEFIKLLVEAGEKVLVYAWHREVYSILLERLSDYDPLMFTGTESASQKQEAKDRFLDSRPILLMSLRAGAGVDGLQKVCRTTVIAELDWSPGVIEQNIGRIHRDGQTDPVTAYFMVADDGADPLIAQKLGLKRQQVEGLRDPHRDLVEELQTDPDKVKELARMYLDKKKKKRAPSAK